MGHVAEHVALELQSLAGTEARHGKTRSAGAEGRYTSSTSTATSRSAWRPAGSPCALVNHLVEPDDPDARFDLPRSSSASSWSPSASPSGRRRRPSSTRRSRATSRSRLDRHSLVQLGQGVHQQRIRATMTCKTSAIAVDIASDKSLTNQLLAAAGLPVPAREVVETEDGAVAAAERIGYPVVVKPLDGNHGRGVCLDLRDDDVRGPSPGEAREPGGDVVVETFVSGDDHRVLVVGGRMVAIAERVPAGVTGDGEHTVRELVEIENSDPRRGIGHEKVLTRIRIDEAAVELVREQGLTSTPCRPAGTRVKLAAHGQHVDRRRRPSTGRWRPTPRTSRSRRRRPRSWASDIAGIDFICPTSRCRSASRAAPSSRSTPRPGFRMHTHPTEGEPQYVAKPVIDLLFPPGPTRASRSSRSPAPTARRRPCA